MNSATCALDPHVVDKRLCFDRTSGWAPDRPLRRLDRPPAPPLVCLSQAYAPYCPLYNWTFRSAAVVGVSLVVVKQSRYPIGSGDNMDMTVSSMKCSGSRHIINVL